MSLRPLKLRALGLGRRAHAFDIVGASEWRRRRLLILGYHGLSQYREHEWHPRLYMTRARLRERLTRIRDGGYEVLPLIEAMWRLRRGALPRRSVVLTFDDGGRDFYTIALPILREFGYPVTVYLTTYYCLKQAPIFPLMCSYILWMAEPAPMETDALFGEPFQLDLTTRETREASYWRLLRAVREREWSDERKQALLWALADAAGVDYEPLLEAGLFQVMHPDQVREIAGPDIDIQLHTHRHRTPDDPQAFRAEIRENRRAIRRITGRAPFHFAYPSGVASPRVAACLRSEGIHSAVTSQSALASGRQHRLSLPRLLDHSGLTADEFDGWLSGAGQYLSRRASIPTLAPDSPAAHIQAPSAARVEPARPYA